MAAIVELNRTSEWLPAYLGVYYLFRNPVTSPKDQASLLFCGKMYWNNCRFTLLEKSIAQI
jgi:hypothetical protein